MKIVIFLSTTGDVLDDAQQAAFERFIRAGKGFLGIHAAADTEYDWAWYGGLVGATPGENWRGVSWLVRGTRRDVSEDSAV